MRKKIIIFVILLIIGITIFVFFTLFHDVEMHKYNFINRILENGGKITSQTNGEAINLIVNQFSKQNIENISGMLIYNIDLSGRDFANLIPSRKLEYLYFTNTTIDETVFEVFAQEKYTLDFLTFGRGQLSDNIGAFLGKIKKIGGLGFCEMKMSDNFFKGSSGLMIENLTIIDTPISEKGLNEMLPLNDLNFIFLNKTRISDDITEFLNKCPNLETIYIHNADIRCEFIQNIKQTDKIKSIEIINTHLDDEIFTSFTRFNNLKELRIINCHISEKSVIICKSLATKVYFIDVRSDNNKLFFQLDPNKY
jgi:hypothetical protein